jgi:hypothetical protein
MILLRGGFMNKTLNGLKAINHCNTALRDLMLLALLILILGFVGGQDYLTVIGK